MAGEPVSGVMGADTGPPLTTVGVTGTAPPVEATGAPEPAEVAAAEPCWAAADSTPPVIVGADTGGTTGDCGGGFPGDPTAFITPSDN